jgi:hypothetical protein
MANGTIFAVLNYGWAILVLAGAAGLWCCSAVRRPGRVRRNLLYSSITLACAAVLLFPVISANDDLQYVAQTCEDSRSSVRSDSRMEPSAAKWALTQTGAGHLPLSHNRFLVCVAGVECSAPESGLIRRVKARPPPLSPPTA